MYAPRRTRTGAERLHLRPERPGRRRPGLDEKERTFDVREDHAGDALRDQLDLLRTDAAGSERVGEAPALSWHEGQSTSGTALGSGSLSKISTALIMSRR